MVSCFHAEGQKTKEQVENERNSLKEHGASGG